MKTDRQRAARRKWKRNNPDKVAHSKRNGRLKREYNITIAQYDTMHLYQGGVCAICGLANQRGQRLAVDHDHKTSKVRGLLCDLCNRGLGLFGDNQTRLLKALLYLRLRS